MRSRRAVATGVVVLTGVAAGCVAMTSSGEGQAAGVPKQSTRSMANTIAHRLFGAGASATLATGGEQLVISVPARTLGHIEAGATPDASDPVLGRAQEAGWKASLAGAYLAATDPALTSYCVDVRGTRIPVDARLPMTGMLRGSPGSPVGAGFSAMLDTVTPAQVRGQIDSSLATLSRVSGLDVSDDAEISIVPVDPAANAFGVEIDIVVADISVLQPYVGDLFLGLATGLVGGPAADIEGLAITVSDRHGHEAGTWQNGRTGAAGGRGSVGFDVDHAGGVHAAYPNLLGGPVRTSSASGHDPGSARARRAGPAGAPAIYQTRTS